VLAIIKTSQDRHKDGKNIAGYSKLSLLDTLGRRVQLESRVKMSITKRNAVKEVCHTWNGLLRVKEFSITEIKFKQGK